MKRLFIIFGAALFFLISTATTSFADAYTYGDVSYTFGKEDFTGIHEYGRQNVDDNNRDHYYAQGKWNVRYLCDPAHELVTMLLFGIGLVGLAAVNKNKLNKKSNSNFLNQEKHL